MQIVKGDFINCFTVRLRRIGILNENEICIYDKQINSDKLYGRSYKYNLFKPTEINDRELEVKHDKIREKLIFLCDELEEA